MKDICKYFMNISRYEFQSEQYEPHTVLDSVVKTSLELNDE